MDTIIYVFFILYFNIIFNYIKYKKILNNAEI